jgi:hypothetical protein
MIPNSDSEEGCDGCVPAYLTTRFEAKAAVSTLPFLLTFALVTCIAYRRVLPLLSSSTCYNLNSPPDKRSTHQISREPGPQNVARRVAALTFSSTIALSAVLTELLLCEISNSFNPTARSVALQITVASLLGLLVVAIPLLGIHTVVARDQNEHADADVGTGKRRRVLGVRWRWQWLLEGIGYAVFLVGFWALGVVLPRPSNSTTSAGGEGRTSTSSLFQACLDRLGITGVTLMALLSGFASVSAIWTTFGPRPRLVSESDITRKQAGLDATMDMIHEKRAKLHEVERKLAQAPSQGFWSKTVSGFRGKGDVHERTTLEMELQGLETMASSLESSLSVLRTRKADQIRSTTPLGRLSIAFSYSFAVYCLYRIIMATFNIFRRLVGRNTHGKADTDPVTSAIALFARHVYPSLDQQGWTNQISFLLSGIMLLASFSAVTQTFHLFARFMPGVLHATRTNFALLISQISGMYVISSALMLRGMMPEHVGGVIDGVLGKGLLEAGWVSRWFDGVFMLAVGCTAAGLFMGKQWGGGFDDDPGWERDVEGGKRS